MAKAMPPMPRNGANLGVYSDDDPTRSAMVKLLDELRDRVIELAVSSIGMLVTATVMAVKVMVVVVAVAV